MMNNTLLPLVLMLVFMAAAWLLGRRTRREQHFDEMQLKDRGDAYRTGFLSMIVLTLVLLLGAEAGLFRWIAPSMALYAALILGVVIFALGCIRRGAFFFVGQQGSSYLLLTAALTVIMAAAAIVRIAESGLTEDGVVT
ncbi:MAG: hypothetical protein IK116_03885, partial [Firmicutes bacterium]|nr:hypothetical protein [Bacillota bacterium]